VATLASCAWLTCQQDNKLAITSDWIFIAFMMHLVVNMLGTTSVGSGSNLLLLSQVQWKAAGQYLVYVKQGAAAL
jgi:hypothetical protein